MSFTHGISGYVLGCRCATCENGTRIYKRAYNQALSDRGICRHCRKPKQTAKVLCLDCLDAAREYQRVYRRRRAQARTEAA